ncbi:MAG TPA: YncE family protein [Bryobacteraceae bacterium]|nr:YncE family protein [Bryobacteraceae bacterium]
MRIAAKQILAFCLGVLVPVFPGVAAPQYRLTGKISLPGPGGWDYAAADSGNRKLYVSHATVVEVIDLDSGKMIGEIPNTNGVHGIAIANDLGRGFISAGRDNDVVIFDLKTLRTIGTAKTGTNPDGIVYEPTTQRVFAFDGRSKDATAIDAKTGTVVGTIALGGKPEFPVADGRGNVFANIEDKNEIVHIDPKTLAVKAHWSIAPAESPSGLAIDTASHRLFSVCDGKVMVVVDYDNGKVVARVPIGDGPDAARFDPGTHLAFSSNGEDGTLTVVKEESKNKFSVVSTVPTEKGARTMAIDLKTHKIYLPDAEFGPAPAATASNPHPRRSIVPGTFHLLVVSE